MTTNNIIVLCAFIAYMIIMIVIGFVCSKGNKNNEDYFLGGRIEAETILIMFLWSR